MLGVKKIETQSGLTQAEAEARFREFGPNLLVPEENSSLQKTLLKALRDPQGLLLIGAGMVYLLLGAMRDAMILFVAVIPVVGVDIFLDIRSESALRALRKAFKPRGFVIRDGAEKEIPVEQIVPGDVMSIREGSIVAADMRLEEVSNLLVDESALTGESEPISKVAGGEVFAGTTVLGGHGMGVVHKTGQRTHYGDIAALVAGTGEEVSPLQKAVFRVTRKFVAVALAVACGVFLLEWWRGYTVGAALIGAVSLAISAIPEEFPLVYTLFLSMGAWRLSRRKVLVRQLSRVETLGSTTVICTDKTGTVTEGKFSLLEVVPLVAVGDDDRIADCALMACELSPFDAMEQGIHDRFSEPSRMAVILRRWRLERDYPFDPQKKCMTHVWAASSGRRIYRTVTKGAIEGILDRTSLDDARKAEIGSLHEQMASRGLRVLALAQKESIGLGPDRVADEQGLEILALLGFADPIREGVREAITACREAGISIKMLTGDHLITAQAIGRQIGLLTDETTTECCYTGVDLERMGEPQRNRAIEVAHVFARIVPRDKFMIVESLKARGQTVAMTGDGVNDAPALKKADIGISMGKKATDVARSTAGMVLLNDDFTSLAAAVLEGRRIFDNLLRAFRYLIGFHIPIVGAALVAPLANWPLMLLPVHMVWLEMIVHPVVSLAFEAEEPQKGVMRRPPRRRDQPLLSRRDLILSIVTGLTLFLGVSGIYVDSLASGSVERARTMAMGVLIVGNLLLVFVERALGAPIWKVRLPRSLRYWGVLVGAALSLPLLVHWNWSRIALGMDPVNLGDWGRILLLSLIAVGWRAVIIRK